MDTLEIKQFNTSSGFPHDVFCINGKPLYEYLDEWLADCNFCFDAKAYDALVEDCLRTF